MRVNAELQQQVVEYINNSDMYTFERFVIEHRLDDDSVKRDHDIIIKCPFHGIDEAPSCSLNDKIHGYHCFACGAKGNYVRFVTDYDIKIQGIRTNYYQKLNDILREDPFMQASLGFSTIYTKDDMYSTNIKEHKRFRANKNKFVPETYLELSTQMKKDKCTKEEIIFAILQMQKKIPANEIYRNMHENERKLQSFDFDINEILAQKEE